MKKVVSQFLILGIFVVLMSSCFTFKPLSDEKEFNPSDLTKIKTGKVYRVHLNTGEWCKVKVTEVVDDGFFCLLYAGQTYKGEKAKRAKIRIVHEDISDVKIRRFSAGKTVALSGAGVVLLTIGAVHAVDQALAGSLFTY